MKVNEKNIEKAKGPDKALFCGARLNTLFTELRQ